jgi:hypothetical protein
MSMRRQQYLVRPSASSASLRGCGANWLDVSPFHASITNKMIDNWEQRVFVNEYLTEHLRFSVLCLQQVQVGVPLVPDHLRTVTGIWQCRHV